MSQKQPSSSKHTFIFLLFSFGIITVVCIILQSLGIIFVTEKTYLIPEGYTGYIWVIYEQTGGVDPGTLFHETYDIPESGIYFADQAAPFIFSERPQFWYVDENGNKIEELILLFSCNNIEQYPPDQVVVCLLSSSGIIMGNEMPPNDQFVILSSKQSAEQEFDVNIYWQIVMETLVPTLFPTPQSIHPH